MSQALASATPASAGASPGGISRTLLAGGIGNVLEWYDFAAYGYFAPIFGRNFFPSDDHIVSLLAAFGVFAAAYIMRPLGGAIFGHIGDRFGRTRALRVSVVAMAFSTFIIGLLPIYASVGPAAPALLIVMRLVQGLSVGGEFTTSVVFLVEHGKPRRRGFIGSWSCFGASTGLLLGSVVGSIVNGVLDAEAVAAWGWRLPFLAGIVLGVAALYLRTHLLHDSPPPGHGAVRMPLVDAFVTEWRNIIRCFVINIGFGVSFYMVFIYVTTYLQQVDNVPAVQALEINTEAMIAMLLLVPAVGWLSDLFGRKLVLGVSLVGLIVLAWPLFRLLNGQQMLSREAGQIGLAILVAGYSGTIPAMMVEMFAARVRCTALSLSYNLALGLIGGTTPLVAVYLIHRTHDDMVPAIYLAATCAISLVGLLTLKDRTGQKLS
jgi:MHS family proline/betaine transporter-like MFS transporter